MRKYGHNVGYIDELYKSFLDDPSSVSEAWREFFKDYRPETTGVRPPPARTQDEGARRLVGATARIVDNMAASLGVPTATSARSIPVKMLEENRRVINAHQSTVSGPRVSFTHLIAWFIVRSLEKHLSMNSAFAEIDGKPHVVARNEIRLCLSIDISTISRGRR
jgi:2-oxoglutarate dehydrogenase E1 component